MLRPLHRQQELMLLSSPSFACFIPSSLIASNDVIPLALLVCTSRPWCVSRLNSVSQTSLSLSRPMEGSLVIPPDEQGGRFYLSDPLETDHAELVIEHWCLSY